ncbi:tRNA pseudouridine(38-40) synthase TruA [Magnetospira sp. QH-2]|uniref:tRNA pseudouridine(38-40) synthase TruA n=1 Tax=Magnetospira sp. (strain QH-2) TaxID=1288970 RepID=UPI0003E80A77|nr:tRNA pseudouridine(38-40) synthase TruA [Magnetospira sp. QH-2]CCQ72209.1 tRNA pseudouridine synthase A (tRNA-uridine isomerase I) (tRNA pseudouridylate synthase I) [Magnetospira sp. QH-2]
MPRYRLLLEYDGSAFVGWQRQVNGLGVQQALEEAAEILDGQPVAVFAAGRTDAGVHATGQVSHMDLNRDMPANRLMAALNFHLRGRPVAVLEAARVTDDRFHARFSAVGRAYLYRILNRRAPAVLERRRVWWVPARLDVEAMHEAAQLLVGHHDFSSFRATHCQANSPVKTLDRLDVFRSGEEIHVIAEARSFLHHQVRNMVGSLRWIGDGKWSADDLKAALAAANRAAGGPTAPADGLYLTRVDY